MPKTIQIRNVPDNVHRILKARAAAERISLSDYVLREVQRSAECPTPVELKERILRRSPIRRKISPTAILRAERDAR